MKLYVLLTMVILSCSSTIHIDVPIKRENKTNQLLFETIIENEIGGYPAQEIRVIRNRESLLEVYGYVNRIRKPGFQIPKIDFSKETIVAVFMGEKNTGGYGVSVEEVKEEGGKLLVAVKETKPKPKEMVTMVITQPFCIVKINSSNKELVFIKE